MSTQELHKKQDQTVLTIHAATFFGKSLKEVYKFYNIEKENTYVISCLFFKNLYKIRKLNNVLDNDYVELNYKVLKRIIYRLHQVMSAYLDMEVKHAKVLSLFVKHLMYVSLKSDDIIRIVKFRFAYSSNTLNMLSQLSPLIAKSNIVNQCAIKTLERFVNRTYKNEIPLELAFILLLDAQTIYYIYDKLFAKGTKAYKTYMIESALLMKLGETPFATIIYNDTEIFHRNNPPEANDIDFKNIINNKGSTFSLPYITDYFGHKAWYDSFFTHHEVNEDNLFRFSLENFS